MYCDINISFKGKHLSLIPATNIAWPKKKKVTVHLQSELNPCFREFPGSPVVRTQHFHCWSLGSIPGWGTKIPQAIVQLQKNQTNQPNKQIHVSKRQFL